MNENTHVDQLLYGNEVTVRVYQIRTGELFYDTSHSDRIDVYKKTDKGFEFIKSVSDYGELYEVEGINQTPTLSNQLILNP